MTERSVLCLCEIRVIKTRNQDENEVLFKGRIIVNDLRARGQADNAVQLINITRETRAATFSVLALSHRIRNVNVQHFSCA